MKRPNPNFQVSSVGKTSSAPIPYVTRPTTRGLAVALLVLGVILGCARTLPPGTSFDRPPSLGVPIEETAWLSRVEMADSSIDDPKQKEMIEANLTVNLYKFLREGNYFTDVKLLPGKPAPHDYVLHFRFDRYKQTPQLTNIMSTEDRSELSGTLSIKSADGQTVKRVHSEITETHPVYPLSPDHIFPSGMKARTTLVVDLLRKGLFTEEADK